MGKHLIGNISEIDPLGARTVRHGDKEIALFRLSDGEVLAIENKCPHKGGKLSEGMVCGGKVHCPLHDWKIDLRNGQVQKPDDGCVDTFSLEIDRTNGSIYLKA